jgi:hypothetical protein
MIAGLLITTIFCTAVWLVFFRFRWIRFTPGWGIISGLFGVHILLIFLIGLHFVTPASTDAKVIQYTIQLIARLPEPTLATAVLVPRVVHIAGYNRLSFTRASVVVNCQSAVTCFLFRLCSQAATSSIKVCLSGIRRSRH